MPVSEARPGGPHERTKQAFKMADKMPGVMIPFITQRAKSIHTYYSRRYPEYQFSWRKGTLYVMKEAE